jgi:hypothetical protein
MGHYDSDSSSKPGRLLPSSKEIKKAIAKAQGKDTTEVVPVEKKRKVKAMSKERRKKVAKRQAKKDVVAEREELMKELANFKLTEEERKKMNKV